MKNFFYILLGLSIAVTGPSLAGAADEAQEQASYIDVGGGDAHGRRLSDEEAEEMKKYIYTLQQGIRSVNDARQASGAASQTRTTQELQDTLGRSGRLSSVQAARDAKATGLA